MALKDRCMKRVIANVQSGTLSLVLPKSKAAAAAANAGQAGQAGSSSNSTFARVGGVALPGGAGSRFTTTAATTTQKSALSSSSSSSSSSSAVAMPASMLAAFRTCYGNSTAADRSLSGLGRVYGVVQMR
jgi:hypothetical protein